MTIAAGFRCKDGVIVCADTQETISGYSKTDTQKITTFSTDEYHAVFAGCGEIAYINAFVDGIKQALTDGKPQGATKVGSVIATSIRESFANSIAPWSSFPAQERPSVELLALQFKASTQLYHADGTALSEVRETMCIGAGLALAKSLMAQLFGVEMNISQAMLVAIYILRQCKRWVDSCGGNTDMVLMTNDGRISNVPSHEVSSLESHFDQFSAAIKPVLIAAADRNVSHEQYETVMRQFAFDMFGLRGRFMETDEFFLRFSKMAGIDLPTSSSSESSTP